MLFASFGIYCFMCHKGNENRGTLTYNIASIPGGKKTSDRNNQRLRIKVTFKGNISIDSLIV